VQSAMNRLSGFVRTASKKLVFGIWIALLVVSVPFRLPADQAPQRRRVRGFRAPARTRSTRRSPASRGLRHGAARHRAAIEDRRRPQRGPSVASRRAAGGHRSRRAGPPQDVEDGPSSSLPRPSRRRTTERSSSFPLTVNRYPRRGPQGRRRSGAMTSRSARSPMGVQPYVGRPAGAVGGPCRSSSRRILAQGREHRLSRRS